MTAVVANRLVMSCDKCPIRLDLGPAQVALNRNRTPSGWLAIGEDRHLCPQCASSVTAFRR